MSGVIGAAGVNSGVIGRGSGNKIAFKQGWGSSDNVAAGVISSSLCNVQNGRDTFNYGGHFDVSTGKFTVPIEGVYCLGISSMRRATNGTTLDIRIIKNATSSSTTNVWARLYLPYSQSYEQQQLTSLCPAVPGDYFVFYNGSGYWSVYNDDSYTFGILIA